MFLAPASTGIGLLRRRLALQQAAILFATVCVLIGCNKPPRITAPAQSPQAVNTEEAKRDTLPRHAGYVGSHRCAECHEEISEQFANHSMGRSAKPLDSSVELPLIEKAQFDAGGFRYSVQRRGNDWIHRQTRLAKDGSEVAPTEFVAKHLIGSGNHGQSFLVEVDSHLLMSPITWYPDKQIWDLSPGYEKNNSQFNRPVIEECLFCHTDLANAVPHTLNKYDSPSIRTHAIGCERCHGPGEQHIALHEKSDASANNDSIVNPANLKPELREAVCQQCHLSGATRVAKLNRSSYDYRPGEPLESAFTVFTTKSQSTLEEGESKSDFVGHVEQMHASRCFEGSNGQLGCISCHDPHQLPAPEEKIAYYRARCLECHESNGCTESMSLREASADNCMHCHMPSRPTEIQHAAVTDHSIPRRSKIQLDAKSTQPEATESGSSRTIVEAFPSNELAKPSLRDKAIALVRIGKRDPSLFTTSQLDAAQASLELAVSKHAQDVEALEALAELYLAGNEFDKAMRACQQVLDLAPKREQTLVIVADTYSSTGNHSFATSFWRRAVEVNPWMSKYWYKLGECYAETGQWKSCQELAAAGKKRFPTSVGLRHLLLRSNLRLGDLEQAKSELRELREYDPVGIERIESWFQEQTKPASTKP